jgi:hypothetical protein
MTPGYVARLREECDIETYKLMQTLPEERMINISNQMISQSTDNFIKESPIFHCGSAGSITAQITWELLWAK